MPKKKYYLVKGFDKFLWEPFSPVDSLFDTYREVEVYIKDRTTEDQIFTYEEIFVTKFNEEYMRKVEGE